MAKTKYELEYDLSTSPKLIYTRLSTPSGLSEWFADNVKLNGKNFIFDWDGSEQEAKVVMKKANEYMRFKWLEDDEESEESYFEFRITKDELTNDVSLIITDFAEDDEIDDSKDLWDQQISELKRAIGL
jgi:uncharacterized protein YndB with AHSA1/START domain